VANVWTNLGKALNVSRIRGLGAEPNKIGWGTGAGISSAADTDLFTPAPEARVTGTSSSTTTNVANDTYTVIGTLIATAARTITNVAQFDATTAGTMWSKSDFSGLGLDLDDGVQFTLRTVFS
jgi:hypothetical protein